MTAKTKRRNQTCSAAIWHGPGHQSKTTCQVTGPHKIHEAVYGSMEQTARWRGKKVFSGYFDKPPKKLTDHRPDEPDAPICDRLPNR